MYRRTFLKGLIGWSAALLFPSIVTGSPRVQRHPVQREDKTIADKEEISVRNTSRSTLKAWARIDFVNGEPKIADSYNVVEVKKVGVGQIEISCNEKVNVSKGVLIVSSSNYISTLTAHGFSVAQSPSEVNKLFDFCVYD